MRGIDLDPARRSRLARECGAAQVRDVFDLLAGGGPMRQFADLSLGVAIDEQIRLRIQQERTAHFLLPVVEVRDATERGFDAANDDRYVAIRLACTLGVNDDGAIGSLAAHAFRG